jgi:hypothetical protein
MIHSGRTLESLQNEIGDRNQSARKTFLCYQLLKQAKEEFDIDTKAPEASFSLLLRFAQVM